MSTHPLPHSVTLVFDFLLLPADVSVAWPFPSVPSQRFWYLTVILLSPSLLFSKKISCWSHSFELQQFVVLSTCCLTLGLKCLISFRFQPTFRVRDRFRARGTYPFSLRACYGECLLRKRAIICLSALLSCENFDSRRPSGLGSLISSSLEHILCFSNYGSFANLVTDFEKSLVYWHEHRIRWFTQEWITLLMLQRTSQSILTTKVKSASAPHSFQPKWRENICICSATSLRNSA